MTLTQQAAVLQGTSLDAETMAKEFLNLAMSGASPKVLGWVLTGWKEQASK